MLGYGIYVPVVLESGALDVVCVPMRFTRAMCSFDREGRDMRCRVTLSGMCEYARFSGKPLSGVYTLNAVCVCVDLE